MKLSMNVITVQKVSIIMKLKATNFQSERKISFMKNLGNKLIYACWLINSEVFYVFGVTINADKYFSMKFNRLVE